MFKLAKYLHEKFPALKEKLGLWQVLSLLDKNPDKIIAIEENDKIQGIGLYIKVTDNILNQIEKKVVDLSNQEHVKFLLNTNGGNVHFLFVTADNIKILLRGIREVIKKENPKTISWYSKSLTHFAKVNTADRKIKEYAV